MESVGEIRLLGKHSDHGRTTNFTVRLAGYPVCRQE